MFLHPLKYVVTETLCTSIYKSTSIQLQAKKDLEPTVLYEVVTQKNLKLNKNKFLKNGWKSWSIWTPEASE